MARSHGLVVKATDSRTRVHAPEGTKILDGCYVDFFTRHVLHSQWVREVKKLKKTEAAKCVKQNYSENA